MNAEALGALQAPLKDKYRAEPAAALITLKAQGRIGEGITCKVEAGRLSQEHKATRTADRPVGLTLTHSFYYQRSVWIKASGQLTAARKLPPTRRLAWARLVGKA